MSVQKRRWRYRSEVRKHRSGWWKLWIRRHGNYLGIHSWSRTGYRGRDQATLRGRGRRDTRRGQLMWQGGYIGQDRNSPRYTSPNDGERVQSVTAGQPTAVLLTSLWVPSHNHKLSANTTTHESHAEEVQTIRGNSATSKLTQLHKRKFFIPMRTEYLSKEQKHESLKLLMFLKEKQYGANKGCVVMDGRKQCESIEPKDATSPTV